MMKRTIPRLVIAATQSGAGKTTLVAGLLAALRMQGLKVQSYKVGPDYIDTGFHALASGRPAHNLDTWLVPKSRLRALFAETVGDADIAVIEGVMGLYDGGRQGVSSTAEIAKALEAPVLLVIDAKSMGASAAALALGFRAYDSEVELAGVLLNRLGSVTHEKMIRTAMESIGMPVYGAVHRDEGLVLPERHLGLTPTTEIEAAAKVQHMGQATVSALDLPAIRRLAASAAPIAADDALFFAACADQPGRGLRLGIARDEAFSFYYPTSLQMFERLGASLVPFRPLHDEVLPDVDGVLIGGGFPEMFAAQLAANTAMRQSIRQAAAAGMPIYAECGGYMYLMEELVDFAGTAHAMCGVLPGRAAMQQRLQMVGYVEACLQQDCLLGPAGTLLHGHEFHFSKEYGQEAAARPFVFKKLRNGAEYPAGQQRWRVLGSYLHLHFAGCPEAARHFLAQCRTYAEEAGR